MKSHGFTSSDFATVLGRSEKYLKEKFRVVGEFVIRSLPYVEKPKVTDVPVAFEVKHDALPGDSILFLNGAIPQGFQHNGKFIDEYYDVKDENGQALASGEGFYVLGVEALAHIRSGGGIEKGKINQKNNPTACERRTCYPPPPRERTGVCRPSDTPRPC